MHIRELFDLSGHVSIVTGAASGIGAAIAEGLAEAGADVVVADLQPDKAETICNGLRKRGLKAEAVTLDVGCPEQIHRVVDQVVDRFGKLDSMFANAGISAGPGPLLGQGHIEDVSAADWDRLLAINLTGVFATMQAAARVMRPRGAGRIIATASTAAFRGDGRVGYGYVATKAAVANLIRQAAIDLGPANVTVNGIAPGPFVTNIGGGRMHEDETQRRFSQANPLPRMGQPYEIKGAALLLASSASSFMTGAIVSVDGGMLAW
jgi:NAD(P)-dependent dehydrogenase (short-subunit alcohol dehydrogenase family)